MEKDIVPQLLELIEKEFDEKTFNSQKLKKAVQALYDKKATYKDVNDFSIEIGELLASVFNNHLTADVLPDGKMYFNIADRILNATLGKNHELISSYAADVQTELNHAASISMKGQIAEINQDKIDGIVNRISSESDFEKIKWILDEPIVNFSQSIVDDTIQSNVEFQAKSGLKPKIVRHASSGCCEWCERIVGIYTYPNVPPDIYRRHRYCRCTVDYEPGSGKQQNIWTKQWVDPEKNAKIEARRGIGIEQQEDLAEGHMQSRLDFIDSVTKEKLFIPKDALIKDSKTIAQGLDIRVVDKLVKEFGGRVPKWKKRVGNVESQKYIHDVHWYENSGKQYKMKLKYRKEKKK